MGVQDPNGHSEGLKPSIVYSTAKQVRRQTMSSALPRPAFL
jgi:hypothetical protein